MRVPSTEWRTRRYSVTFRLLRGARAEWQRTLTSGLERDEQATVGWVGGAATAVGSGVTAAAGTVSRPFRSVDLDGDGIPDQPQMLTAAKGVLDGIKHLGAGLAGLAGLVRPKQWNGHETGHEDE
jgi:hypothetical protein